MQLSLSPAPALPPGVATSPRRPVASVVRALGLAFQPLGAILFLVLWCVAEAGRYHTTGDIAALVVYSACIAVSRIFPTTALAMIGATLLAQLLGVLPLPDSTTWPVYFAVPLSVFSIALFARSPRQWLALALGIPLTIAVTVLMVVPFPGQPYRWTSWTGQGSTPEAMFNSFLLLTLVGLAVYGGCWALGLAFRLKATELRSAFLLRSTAADLGVAEVELQMVRERDQIARDVHDVLAHSLAVVIAQADGARFIGDAKPGAVDTALRAISDSARSALVDVRTLIEGLREKEGLEPQPALVDLAPLIDRVAAAGLRITTLTFGQPRPMTPAQELAVYRIVQECLTNALKHGGTKTSTRISFDWRGPGLALTVGSHGDTAPATDTPDTSPGAVVPVDAAGHGIRGMKDRARLAGGWLTAGRSSETGDDFLVTVFIPAGPGEMRE
ncbi:MAG: hypothetical protein JWQ43_4105 [Glaciihabitans sp.]|nr:hypothetical protein [Glaciihabitans sp.]